MLVPGSPVQAHRDNHERRANTRLAGNDGKGKPHELGFHIVDAGGFRIYGDELRGFQPLNPLLQVLDIKNEFVFVGGVWLTARLYWTYGQRRQLRVFAGCLILAAKI